MRHLLQNSEEEKIELAEEVNFLQKHSVYRRVKRLCKNIFDRCRQANYELD